MFKFSNRYSFVWLQTDPTAALEECILSILVGIARHSPRCVNAIMKCQRLVETVVHRFTMEDTIESYPSKIKSVSLLRVRYFITFFFLGEFYIVFSIENLFGLVKC